MNTTTKNQALTEYAHKLIQSGFDVYTPEEPSTYMIIAKDGKLGYVKCGDFGLNFSTVHKPCRECGTGFSTSREIFNPTLQLAEDSLIFAPDWASSADRQAIRKYKDWGEYAKVNNWQKWTNINS